MNALKGQPDIAKGSASLRASPFAEMKNTKIKIQIKYLSCNLHY